MRPIIEARTADVKERMPTVPRFKKRTGWEFTQYVRLHGRHARPDHGFIRRRFRELTAVLARIDEAEETVVVGLRDVLRESRDVRGQWRAEDRLLSADVLRTLHDLRCSALDLYRPFKIAAPPVEQSPVKRQNKNKPPRSHKKQEPKTSKRTQPADPPKKGHGKPSEGQMLV